MLMLDDSGSVSNENFAKVKQFVKTLANDDQIKDQMDKENVQIRAGAAGCRKYLPGCLEKNLARSAKKIDLVKMRLPKFCPEGRIREKD